MVDKSKVLAGFQRNNQLSPTWTLWFHEYYDHAHNIASYAQQRVPGIGLMSGKKRLDAFYTVCEVVQNEMMKEDGFSLLDYDEKWRRAQVILQIIRFMDSNFDTAAATFEHMARYLKPHEVGLMPELAMMYATEYRLREKQAKGSLMNVSVSKKYLSGLAAAAFGLSWLLVAMVSEWQVPGRWVRHSVADDLAWEGTIYLWFPLLSAAMATSYAVAVYATEATQKKIGIVAFLAGAVVFYFITLSGIHTVFLLTAIACVIAYDWVYGAKHQE